MASLYFAVIIEHGVHETFLLGRNTISAHLLFWGPDITCHFLRNDPRPGWDIRQSDYGAAVLDLDKKQLLFFGGEHLPHHIPYRREFLRLMQYNWPGFAVRWAHNGIFDILQYLGLEEPEEYRRPRRSHTDEQTLWCFDTDSYDVAGALTLERDDRLLIYPIYDFLDRYEELLFVGERLATAFAARADYAQYHMEHATESADDWFPQMGIHIAPQKKELSYWLASPFRQNSKWVTHLWPGYSIRYWGDDFEQQLLHSLGRLQVTYPARITMQQQIREQVTCGRDTGTTAQLLGGDLTERFDALVRAAAIG